MNKFLVTMLLLCLTLAQLIRIETVTGQDSLASITPDAKTNSDALSTTEVEPTQRQADLKRTGLAPYRLEPPDIITIGVAAAGSNVPNGVGGQHLVGPDGTVRLGEYGSIFVTGMTLAEAQDAIQAKLSDVLDDPQVALGLFARNSKCVYVVSKIGTGPNFVLRVPCNIDTNVKDVLSQAVTKHPVSLSQVKIWVQRHSDGKPQQLHVDWESVAKQKHHPTNHLLLPGDRVFVATEELSSAPKPAVAATPPPEYLIPDAPRYSPTALQQTPTDANDEPRIQVQITVVKDRKGNLAEFEPLRESGFLLADTVSTRGTLRTLEKNCLIEVIASPAVQCTSGTTANVIIGDHLSPPWRRLAADFERLREAGHIPPDRQLPKPANQVRVEVTPSIHEDSQIHLQAKTEVTTRGEMVRVESELMVTPGKTVILRQKEAPGEAKEKENDGAVYLVLTPSLVR